MKHPTNRSERRFAQQVYDAKTKRIYSDWPEGWIRARYNRTICSCWMCGNRRKYEGRTLNEKRFDLEINNET